jgi:hypothetical protein
MKIAVIDTGFDDAPAGEARAFLSKLLSGLTVRDNEVHLFRTDAPTGLSPTGQKAEFFCEHSIREALAGEEAAPVLAKKLNEMNPDAYFIWASEDLGWTVLPLLDPEIATLAIGHADSETFYVPARHYRSFLTRVIGTTPETCVGFVLSCVIEKEKVEWIDYNEQKNGKDFGEIVENFENCFEKAIADAHAAPREAVPDFPPLKPSRPKSISWFGKLKAKIMN